MNSITVRVLARFITAAKRMVVRTCSATALHAWTAERIFAVMEWRRERWMWQAAAALAASALGAVFVQAAEDAWVLQQGLHVYPYSGGDPAKLTPHVLVFLPQGYEQRKSPLMVLLHNTGDAGSDVQRLKSHGMLKYVAAHLDFPFITASPQAAAASYGVFGAADVNALVDDLVKRLPVDTSRIYLTGVSTNAVTALRIAAETQRFAAVVPISSARLDPAVACSLKGTSVWAFHNEKDPVRELQPCQGHGRRPACLPRRSETHRLSEK